MRVVVKGKKYFAVIISLDILETFFYLSKMSSVTFIFTFSNENLKRKDNYEFQILVFNLPISKRRAFYSQVNRLLMGFKNIIIILLSIIRFNYAENGISVRLKLVLTK